MVTYHSTYNIEEPTPELEVEKKKIGTLITKKVPQEKVAGGSIINHLGRGSNIHRSLVGIVGSFASVN